MDFTENQINLMVTEIKENRKIINLLKKDISSLYKHIKRFNNSYEEEGVGFLGDEMNEILLCLEKMESRFK